MADVFGGVSLCCGKCSPRTALGAYLGAQHCGPGEMTKDVTFPASPRPHPEGCPSLFQLSIPGQHDEAGNTKHMALDVPTFLPVR